MHWCVRDMHLQVHDMVQMNALDSWSLRIHRRIAPALSNVPCLLASLCRKLIDVKNWGVILLCFLHLHFQYPRVRKFFCNMILLVDCFWVSHYIS